jgi:hypothetical protein
MIMGVFSQALREHIRVACCRHGPKTIHRPNRRNGRVRIDGIGSATEPILRSRRDRLRRSLIILTRTFTRAQNIH